MESNALAAVGIRRRDSESSWIFGSAWLDLALLYWPGFATLVLALAFARDLPSRVLLGFLVLYALDSGHGYVTALRVHLRPGALHHHPVALRRFYWLTPVLVFALAGLWSFARVPGLWTALVYTTLFHHLRQLYGVLRWYQKLNGRVDRWSHRYLYALLGLPIVYLHGRPDRPVEKIFVEGDLLLFDWPVAQPLLITAYGLVLCAWLVFELRTWRAGRRELNRLTAIALPAALSALCLFGGRTLPEVLYPMLVLHAVAYCALVGLSMERTETRRRVAWPWAVGLALGLAALCGLLEWGLRQDDALFDYRTAQNRLWSALAVAAAVTVPLSHYVLDAVIWRGDHPDAHAIYGRGSNRNRM